MYHVGKDNLIEQMNIEQACLSADREQMKEEEWVKAKLYTFNFALSYASLSNPISFFNPSTTL